MTVRSFSLHSISTRRAAHQLTTSPRRVSSWWGWNWGLQVERDGTSGQKWENSELKHWESLYLRSECQNQGWSRRGPGLPLDHRLEQSCSFPAPWMVKGKENNHRPGYWQANEICWVWPSGLLARQLVVDTDSFHFSEPLTIRPHSFSSPWRWPQVSILHRRQLVEQGFPNFSLHQNHVEGFIFKKDFY